MSRNMVSPLFMSAVLVAGVASQVIPQTYPFEDAVGFAYGQEYFTMPQGHLPLPSTLYSNGPYERVIFISFDGMHQFDLTRFVGLYPNSTFATMLKNSVAYSNARTSSPSDSLPATASLFTGAAPSTHGIFWEQMFDRSLYTGGTNCSGPIGAVCDFSEAADLNSSVITGGNGFNLTYLPHQLTAWGTCEPVLPHDFLRVNTVFEVGRGNGIYTAYADKHLSYEFVNGPSGTGLSEGYFPEIAAVDSTLEAQQAWDDLHWSALANWTNGNFLNGSANPYGGPRMYSANFQAITWAQANTGYLDGAGTPNASLATAFETADQRLGAFLDVLKSTGKLNSTLLLVGSKQGQGPINPNEENLLDPSVVTDALSVPVAFFNGEDGGIVYLQNPSDAAQAKQQLLSNASVGIEFILIGDEVQAAGFGTPRLNSRTPDMILGAKIGTLWNSGFEFEDHGGFLPQDLNVPLFAYNPNIASKNVTDVVYNRQVASTMLQALGLPLAQLNGFAQGESPVLPKIFDC